MMLIALPPLDAYRADTAAAPDATTPDDGEWLTVATLVARAAALPAGARASTLRTIASMTDAVGSDDRATVITLAVRTATAMEDAARFHMAYSTLSGVLQLLPASDALGRGRVVAQQGRIARQLGDYAVAKERYQAAEEAAADCESDASSASELRARAWVGFGVLAHLRGNLPEARSWFRKVLDAEGSPREQQQVAHTQLMIAAASARDFDTAAIHAWAAVQAADGDQLVGALGNLAQVFLEAGHARVALRVFGSVLLKGPLPRYELPVLGGACVAAARGLSSKRATPLIERFADRIQALMATTQLPFEQVTALADMSEAYAALGAGPAATKMRAQALALAERYGFHEFSHKLREMETATPLTRVATLRAAAPVAEAVQAFETTEEVELALQPA